MQITHIKNLKRRFSVFLAFLMIISLITIPTAAPAFALKAESLEDSRVGAIVYSPSKEAATMVTLRGRYTGSGNQLAPVAPAFLTSVGISGETHTTGNLGDSSAGTGNIRIENDNPGTIFGQSNTWVRWPSIDLKGGIKAIRMTFAANGDSRTVNIRVGEPGAGFNAADVVATIVLGSARPAGDWQQRWIRWPSPPTPPTSYPLPFISTASANSNPTIPAGTSCEENPSWPVIEDSKRTGVCDVFVQVSADSQLSRVVLELKPEPVLDLPFPDDSKDVSIAPDSPHNITVLSDDAWVKWGNLDIQGGLSTFYPIYNAVTAGSSRSIQLLVADPGAPGAPSKIDDAVLAAWVGANASGNDVAVFEEFIRYHTGGLKDIYIRFINAQGLVLHAPQPRFFFNPIAPPGLSWVNTAAPDAAGSDWVRYNDVDLKAGLKSFDVEYTGSGDHERNFDVFIAQANERENIGTGSILANGRTILLGGIATSSLDPSKYGPGIAVNHNANTMFDGTLLGGVRDVYVRTRGATTSLNKLTLYLEDGTEPPGNVWPEPYVESNPVRPAAADVVPYLRTQHNAHAAFVTSTDNYGRNGETPMGNGYMGATIYGGAVRDYIIINEKTLWSGGPSASESYNGSHGRNNVTSATSKTMLASIRDRMQTEVTNYGLTAGPTVNYPATLFPTSSTPTARQIVRDIEANLFGPKNSFGDYQELGRILLLDEAFPSVGNPPSETSVYEASTYRRYLNLEAGITTTNYRRIYNGDNNQFKKEYFMNYPSNVFAVKVSAQNPFTHTVTFETLQSLGKIFVDPENHVIQMSGQPAGQLANGIHYIMQMKVVAKDAAGNDISDTAITPSGTTALKATNVSELIVIMAAGTNYQNILDTSFIYSDDYRAMNVTQKNQYINSLYLRNKDEAAADVKRRLNAAVQKGYNALLKEHLDDYQKLFGRVDFQLTDAAGVPIPIPTRQTSDLVSRSNGNSYNNASSNEKRYIEMLYFQFGRYLMISSSREGSLPANLQGVWGYSLNMPWNADYHTNVNLEMNYWPVQTTNLAESSIPMLEYINAQVPRGSITADWYHYRMDGTNTNTGLPMRGWTSYHENNIWGNTGPGNYWQGAYAPAGGTWLSQDIWEYYQFNMDKEILKKYYDALIGAALFWVDNLYEDTSTRVNGVPGTGKLVSAPSFSPEHGPYDLGTTFEQGVIWETLNNAEKAYVALQDDADFVSSRDAIVVKRDGAEKSAATEIAEIAAAKARLYVPYYDADKNEYVGIGSWANGANVGKGNGQFMEWRYESLQDARGWNDSSTGPPTSGSDHRHVNHLFFLHPGSMIVPGRSAVENKFADAMKVTLNTRGDAGTGWSRAWKINFWARLRDGERALTLYGSLLNGSTLPNLWDTHDPYQIDGNFGGTSGVAEMLLQSHSGSIELLAALPQTTWANGHANGLKARGNVEVDMAWSNGKLTKAELRPGTTGTINVKYPNLSDFAVYKNGTQIDFDAALSSDEVQFNVAAGDVLVLREYNSGLNAYEYAGKVTAYFNNTGTSAVSGDLIVGIFNSEGRLVCIETKEFSAAINTMDIKVFDVDTSAYAAGHKIKVFAFDRNFVPLDAAVQVVF